VICVLCGAQFDQLGELCARVTPQRFHEPPSTRAERNASAAEFVADLHRAARAQSEFATRMEERHQ